MNLLAKKENIWGFKIWLWLSVISYMTLIFYLSSMPGVGDYELPYGADKVIHFFEYAVLSF